MSVVAEWAPQIMVALLTLGGVIYTQRTSDRASQRGQETARESTAVTSLQALTAEQRAELDRAYARLEKVEEALEELRERTEEQTRRTEEQTRLLRERVVELEEVGQVQRLRLDHYLARYQEAIAYIRRLRAWIVEHTPGADFPPAPDGLDDLALLDPG